MKICLVDGFSEAGAEKMKEALNNLGHTVNKECDGTYDFIFNASVIKFQSAKELSARYPHIPVINYCWDFYKWAWEHDNGYNWPEYGKFLVASKDVWVPGEGTKLRLKEYFGIESQVIKTAIDVYGHDISDKRFVLDPVREYPEENNGWVRKACEELGIPCVFSDHSYSKEKFRELVSTCTFMTCAYREASTGGLTLMEGLWNGKTSLISNSPYMGGKDYLGEFAEYFQYDDYEDLKRKIKEMWDNPPKIDKKRARNYMWENFTYEVMAQNIHNRLCELKKS